LEVTFFLTLPGNFAVNAGGREKGKHRKWKGTELTKRNSTTEDDTTRSSHKRTSLAFAWFLLTCNGLHLNLKSAFLF
jgi:hypothetical protein